MKKKCLILALTLTLTMALTGWAREKTFTNELGMEFVLIPAGSFLMGATPGFEGDHDSDVTQHAATISQAFYLGKYEVTQEQWAAVTGGHPGRFKGRSRPVESVSWEEVQAFIKRLNQHERRGTYRLPTEAEWEYAARAGRNGPYFFEDEAGELGQYAWYEANSGDQTLPVGRKRPNPWGLYDIYGNVWEWVEDWYGDYVGSPASDPRGPSSGSKRVNRGGGWNTAARGCRSATRSEHAPDSRFSFLGFRLAFSPGQ